MKIDALKEKVQLAFKSIVQTIRLRHYLVLSTIGLNKNSSQYNDARTYNSYVKMSSIVFNKDGFEAKIRVPMKTTIDFVGTQREKDAIKKIEEMNPSYTTRVESKTTSWVTIRGIKKK